MLCRRLLLCHEKARNPDGGVDDPDLSCRGETIVISKARRSTKEEIVLNHITLSIVTVSRNASSTIDDCVASIRHQRVPVEHIIIDGASQDDTVQRIEHSGATIAHLLSEPDHGMYDAMNKGLALATGEVVGILNADDFYAHRHVLKEVARVFSDSTVDACYGDVVYIDAAGSGRVVRAWKSCDYEPSLFYRGWMPPHPSFFVRRRIYTKCGGFDLRLGTSADYELMLRLLVRYGCTAKYIPHTLVVMRMGGASNASLQNRIKANRMDRLAWSVNGLRPRPWTLLLKPASKIGQYVAPRFSDKRVNRWWLDHAHLDAVRE